MHSYSRCEVFLEFGGILLYDSLDCLFQLSEIFNLDNGTNKLAFSREKNDNEVELFSNIIIKASHKIEWKGNLIDRIIEYSIPWEFKLATAVELSADLDVRNSICIQSFT